ncbi:hypothetical protein HDK77DRAFT_378279 [Phyllosticta capitalensis]|uniref:BHLH domain-containing protein n=1 Tax=Phyllosticta capitalensis TaxID=121624 RepID=A0ABR1YH67_9PEZI
MALNWNNSFLPDDALNPQGERWNLPSRTSSQSNQPGTTSTAPATHASAPPTTQAPDFAQFDTAGQETYFSDAFYNDPNNYFLSDLDVLEPLGNVTLAGSTSESSPENYNDVTQVDLTDPSRMARFEPASSTMANPPMTSTATASSSRQRPGPPTASLVDIQQNYAKAFPSDPRSQAYVEDLTYSQPSRQSSKQTVNTLETVNEFEETDLTSKRNRSGNTNADSISACWTSPLCPNHKKEGTPPNPSTCNGGCAPFLFADEAPLFDPNSGNLLGSEPLPSKESPEGVVEIQSRPKLKRSESDANRDAPSGRVFSKSGSAATDPEPQQQAQAQLKNESSPSSHSPEDTTNVQPTTEGDNKNKGRRRLPHNQVERKYRESLNTQLESLRRVVPALQQSSRGCEGGDIEDLPTPSKPSKAVVLASATAYIKQMEKDKRQLADENQLLRSRIKALQALVKCEDCSLMQYVMDLKLHNGAPGG